MYTDQHRIQGLPAAREPQDLQVLTRGECLALMATTPIGRVVFTDQALPAIQPVNFILDGDDVVIRTRPGSKLAAATRRAVVAFEVDDLDPVTGTGWTITVIGQALPVRNADEIDRLSRLALRPWSPEPLPHYIRIHTHRMTGRRLDGTTAL
jgi:uncharacterized protein